MTDTRNETREPDMDPASEPISTEDIAATATPRVDRNGVTGTEHLPSTEDAETGREAAEKADVAPRADMPKRADTEAPEDVAKRSDVAEQSPLFDEATARDLRERWTEVQTGFVDEPRSSVEHADALVADVMRRLAESFATERKTLEGQWSRGDDVSTEDLRVALQRYRSFFDRLLSI